MARRRRIGITLGDPAGIGPEVVRRALAEEDAPDHCEYLVIGDERGFTPGSPSKKSAEAALIWLEEAAALAGRGDIDAVVTGPVSKKAMHEIGFLFPGQTEFFAERSGTTNYAMCLTGGRLTVVLVTAHIPLKEVAARLEGAEIVRVARLLAGFLKTRGCIAPRIAVAGLNPHAGEGGDLGQEEIETIQPAMELLCRTEDTSQYFGPLSPDTVFHEAVAGAFDGVVCMYHDQGLIPLKLHAFDDGVNVTLGLPYLRCSPDHGTAFAIAGRGIARPDSMRAALRLAQTKID